MIDSIELSYAVRQEFLITTIFSLCLLYGLLVRELVQYAADITVRFS